MASRPHKPPSTPQRGSPLDSARGLATSPIRATARIRTDWAGWNHPHHRGVRRCPDSRATARPATLLRSLIQPRFWWTAREMSTWPTAETIGSDAGVAEYAYAEARRAGERSLERDQRHRQEAYSFSTGRCSHRPAQPPARHPPPGRGLFPRSHRDHQRRARAALLREPHADQSDRFRLRRLWERPPPPL